MLGTKEKEKEQVEKKSKEEKEEKAHTEEKEEEKDTTEPQDQSMQDIQVSPPSPPHATITPIDIIKIKDVIDTSNIKINPLTTEDLEILDQSSLVEKLSSNPVLVNVDELQNPEVKVKALVPSSTIQTTGILFLPPPSPPSIVTYTLQMPSTIAREIKETFEQPKSSTPPSNHKRDIQAKEKDETKKKEETAL